MDCVLERTRKILKPASDLIYKGAADENAISNQPYKSIMWHKAQRSQHIKAKIQMVTLKKHIKQYKKKNISVHQVLP
jgi:hypothetical protein